MRSLLSLILGNHLYRILLAVPFFKYQAVQLAPLNRSLETYELKKWIKLFHDHVVRLELIKIYGVLLCMKLSSYNKTSCYKIKNIFMNNLKNIYSSGLTEIAIQLILLFQNEFILLQTAFIFLVSSLDKEYQMRISLILNPKSDQTCFCRSEELQQ